MRRTSAIAAFGLATLACLVLADPVVAQPTTRIAHTPVKAFVPSSRTLVWATLADDAPPVAFRCYFREAGGGDYGFVDMLGAGGNRFVAFLPAAAPRTAAIEYVLLAANARREVLRTGVFTMTRASASGQAVPDPHLGDQTARGEVYVTQDLPQAASSLPGFADQIRLVGVAPDKRFGQVVLGLYDSRRKPRDGWPTDCTGIDIVADTPAQDLPGVLPAPPTDPLSDDAYKMGEGVTPPQAVREVKPRYTAAAMRAKVQGVVLVRCLVLADGTVGRAEVVKSLDPTFGLDFEAVAAASQWRLKPATRDGRPVPVAVVIQMTFELR